MIQIYIIGTLNTLPNLIRKDNLLTGGKNVICALVLPLDGTDLPLEAAKDLCLIENNYFFNQEL